MTQSLDTQQQHANTTVTVDEGGAGRQPFGAEAAVAEGSGQGRSSPAALSNARPASGDDYGGPSVRPSRGD